MGIERKARKRVIAGPIASLSNAAIGGQGRRKSANYGRARYNFTMDSRLCEKDKYGSSSPITDGRLPDHHGFIEKLGILYLSPYTFITLKTLIQINHKFRNCELRDLGII